MKMFSIIQKESVLNEKSKSSSIFFDSNIFPNLNFYNRLAFHNSRRDSYDFESEGVDEELGERRFNGPHTTHNSL